MADKGQHVETDGHRPAEAAPSVRLRPAAPADIDDLIRLQAAYYREDGYAHCERDARVAWEDLLADPRNGRVWVAESEDGVGGYLAVTFGFSLEFLGREATIDELYLVPALRGRGLGLVALDVAERVCRELGLHAVHLEIEGGKQGVIDLYRRAGFASRERILMSKRLMGKDPDVSGETPDETGPTNGR